MAKRRRRARSSREDLVPILGVGIGIVVLVRLASEPSFWITVLIATTAGMFIWRWRSSRKRTRFTQLMQLLALTPVQFEHAVADLLRDLGYRKVERVGRAGDLAADLLAVDPNGRTVAVQCKRYAPGAKVGSPDVQTFIGMVTVHHGTERGVFVTTSEFSAPARDLAARHGIELFDGARLSEALESVSASGGSLRQSLRLSTLLRG